jgi:ribonucleoside-diphosphate reductase alpha chain
MCGTGLGYSVEHKYIKNLPEIAEHFEDSDTTIHVADSKAGWARGLKELMAMVAAGQIPQWDLSRLRPKGAVLKTFGGRSSGPDPLDDLFRAVVVTLRQAAGRQLTSLECHDIMCIVADCVVSGGVRRSALMCLSDLQDDRMRNAKSGRWYDEDKHPYRANANISAITEGRPPLDVFMDEWKALYMSGSGERGFMNRKPLRNYENIEWGTNPCSEILLRPFEFCNLSEAVIRDNDTLVDVERKVIMATIMGTLQSTLTNFKYLRKRWQQNCEEERLLGVSLTGIMDHWFFNTLEIPGHYGDFSSLRHQAFMKGVGESREQGWNMETWGLRRVLEYLRQVVIDTNTKWAKRLGVSPSVCTTCVKPSGTVSQLALCSPGINANPAGSQYYLRRVRQDDTDPMTQFLKDQGVPHEESVHKRGETVFQFPLQTGPSTVFRRSAIEQLELWLVYQRYWCQHKPSITVMVDDDEWLEVAAWVYKHFDEMTGVAFLPRDGGIYKQAPYTPLDKDEYDAHVSLQPQLDWDKLASYEADDHTTSSQELACVSGVCEI